MKIGLSDSTLIVSTKNDFKKIRFKELNYLMCPVYKTINYNWYTVYSIDENLKFLFEEAYDTENYEVNFKDFLQKVILKYPEFFV